MTGDGLFYAESPNGIYVQTDVNIWTLGNFRVIGYGPPPEVWFLERTLDLASPDYPSDWGITTADSPVGTYPANEGATTGTCYVDWS